MRYVMRYLLVLVVIAGLCLVPVPFSQRTALDIGFVSTAEASILEFDYVVDGVDDNEQIQAALDALSSTGGALRLWNDSTGNNTYNFSAPVTRAIDNVMIVGMGAATQVNGNNSMVLFQAGGNNWLFKNLALDAGGVDLGSGSDCYRIEMWIGGAWTHDIGGGGGGGAGNNTFVTINAPLGTDPVADSPTDILTLANTDTYIDITGNATTDTINFTLDGAVTLDIEWNTIGEIETATSVNIVVETEIDSEGELEALLIGVADVFTDNDGALDDDDLSDNSLNDIGDVNAGAPNNNDSLTWDTGTSRWIPEAVVGSQLTQEEVEDYIGSIINDGDSVQTRITVTYDDADDALDFIVDDLDTNLTQEEVEDLIGGIINDGDSIQTRITVTYNDGTDSLDFVVDDLGATLTQEQVDDYIALLINDGDSVHTRIAITYDDADNAYDFVVDSDLSNYTFASVTDAILEQALKVVNAAVDEDILTYESTTGDFEWHTPDELITAGDNLAWTDTTLNATDTQLTPEEVSDLVAALLNDGDSVHTRITITYDDVDDAYDFVVDDMADDMGDVDTEDELETALVDVYDVYTDNDGSLDDDDLSDNALNDLGDVNAGAPGDNQALTWDDGTSKWIPETISGSQLTQEEVEDYIGGIVNDGDSVQTRITVTYDDADNALDFVVDDLDTTLTQEEVEDLIGGIINDGDSVQTRITVTYDDVDNALDFVVDDLDSTLTQEEVDDYVSLLINDGDSVHTRITITYDDADNAYDFVVDNDLSNYSFASVTNAILEQALKAVNGAVDEDILTYETTTGDFEWHTPDELITAGDNLAWDGTTLDATNTQLTQEEVDDLVAALINDAESVHTRITITYDDANDAYDFVVDDMADDMGDVDTEDELEAALGDVTDVFTDNDGALSDDDLSDNDVDALQNVTVTAWVAGEYLRWSGTALVDATIQDADLPDTITRDSEWNTIGEIETATSVNIIISTEIDSEGELETLVTDVANFFTDNDTIPAANLHADITRDTEWDSEGEVETAWGAINIIISTEIDSEAKLEALLGDVSDVFTDNDGALDDDDITDDDLSDLADVNAGAPNNNDSLTWDTGTGKWIPEAIAAGDPDHIDDDDNDTSVYTHANDTITMDVNGNEAFLLSDDGILTLTKQSAARVVRIDTGFAVASETDVNLDANSVVYDIQGEYNLTTDVFTCKEAGTYLVTGSALFVLLQDGKWAGMYVEHNDIRVAYNANFNFSGGDQYTYAAHTAVVRCEAADTLEVVLYHNDPDSRSVLNGAMYTHASFTKIT